MTSPGQPVRRVRVVGSAGAGKTTFAQALADRLGVEHIELDEVFWDAGWVHRDPEQARANLREFLASPAGAAGWVSCGNWHRARQELLEDADTVVFLDYARPVVMARLVRRTLRRLVTREELWHGNREQVANLLSRDPHRNVLVWSWTNHARIRSEYAALQDEGRVPVVRLRSPRAARSWLRSIGA